MNRKKTAALLLAGILAIPMPYAGNVMAADFSDGETEGIADDMAKLYESGNRAEEDGIFSSGDGEDSEMFCAGEESEDTQTFAAGEEIEEKPADEVIDGVLYLYNEETDSYLVYAVMNTEGETVYLEREIHGRKVTEIGWWIYEECFEDASEPLYLGEIVIPDTVTKLDSGALRDGQMMRLDLPDSIMEIGNAAFYYCGNLRWLHFPAGTQVFPANLFNQCASLHTIEIPEGVVKIESGAMKGCPALNKLYISETVTEIGEDLFDEGVSPVIYGKRGSYAETYASSHGLLFIGEGEPEPELPEGTKILDGVYYTYQEDTDSYLVSGFDGDILKEICIPETMDGKPVTGIGENAFLNCTLLEKIELPSTITRIGDGAFERCTSLEEITIRDGVEEIGARAFSGCRHLKALLLPDSVHTIGQRAFYQCVDLDELKLPSYMEELDAGIFYETKVKNPLKIPEGVTILKSETFAFCMFDELVLPDTLKTIETNAFIICSISRVKIPASVTKIEKNVFNEDIGTLVVEDGSYGESYAKKNGLIYDDGTEEVGKPKVQGTVYSGNNIRLSLKDKCKNAQFYDYVITSTPYFPGEGVYLYRQNKSTALKQNFENLSQGTYYLYARSGRRENGKDIYGPWSEKVEVTVSIQTPQSPAVQEVTVDGSVVTVTVSEVADTKGYGIVLASNRTKNGCQRLLKPKNICYASTANKSTTYVFKNVKPGTYCVLTRSYTKDSNGKNVYSKWSGYNKKIQVV